MTGRWNEEMLCFLLFVKNDFNCLEVVFFICTSVQLKKGYVAATRLSIHIRMSNKWNYPIMS